MSGAALQGRHQVSNLMGADARGCSDATHARKPASTREAAAHPTVPLCLALIWQLAVFVKGIKVKVLFAGNCVGEQSMVKRQVALATVRALTYCELYRLPRQAFDDLQSEFVQSAPSQTSRCPWRPFVAP